MKLEGNSTHFKIIPESDMDCVTIGKISTMIDNTLACVSDSDNRMIQVNFMQINSIPFLRKKVGEIRFKSCHNIL